jgi:hypothetical protein
MHHSDFIALLAKIYKPKVYVELGLYEGESLRKIQPFIEKGYGVDMNKNIHLENLKTFSNLEIIYIKTNDFFEDFEKK